MSRFLPRFVLGALILLGVWSGAFLVQIGPWHGDVIHVLVLGSLLCLAAWLIRPSSLLRAARHVPSPDDRRAKAPGEAHLAGMGLRVG
jgi:hypothetical protein